MVKKEVNLTPQQVNALIERERIRLEAIRRNQSLVQQALLEMAGTLDSLKAIKASEKGEKILVSLGSGVFTQASIENNETVKNALAGDIMLDKSIDESIKLIEERRDKLQDEAKTLAMEEGRILQNISELGKGLTQLREQLKQKKETEKQD